MPRKTKDQNELNEEENKKVKSSKSVKEEKVAKKTTSKTKASKSSENTKKRASAKSSKKATSTKKKTLAKRNTSTKKDAPDKKTSTLTEVDKAEDIVAPVAIQPTADPSKFKIIEYYDLPYRYNQTVVKVLAQTPTTLFIYWDISDKDRKDLKEKYGDNFFEVTKPILIVYNETLGYNFEVEINDFANSWYLHVNDAKCKYRVELGRRPIPGILPADTNSSDDSFDDNSDNSFDNSKNIEEEIPNYIYISVSNEMESPNNHILFNPNQNEVHFKNIKTGVETIKEISSIPSLKHNAHKIYSLYNLYQAIYQDENVEEIYDLSNPSSGGNPSSSTSSR